MAIRELWLLSRDKLSALTDWPSLLFAMTNDSIADERVLIDLWPKEDKFLVIIELDDDWKGMFSYLDAEGRSGELFFKGRSRGSVISKLLVALFRAAGEKQ